MTSRQKLRIPREDYVGGKVASPCKKPNRLIWVFLIWVCYLYMLPTQPFPALYNSVIHCQFTLSRILILYFPIFNNFSTKIHKSTTFFLSFMYNLQSCTPFPLWNKIFCSWIPQGSDPYWFIQATYIMWESLLSQSIKCIIYVQYSSILTRSISCTLSCIKVASQILVFFLLSPGHFVYFPAFFSSNIPWPMLPMLLTVVKTTPQLHNHAKDPISPFIVTFL